MAKHHRQLKQVCVQPPPSAVSVTLPAFAAERRAAAGLLLSAGACCTTIAARLQLHIDLLHAGCSAANPPHAAAAVDRWDRQIDRRTLDRYTDPAPHTMRTAASIIRIRKTILPVFQSR